MIRVEVSYQGRVQGVGFRATVHHIARSFQVTGWVRNEPDGSVSLAVQGDPAQIDAFLTEISTRLARNIKTATRVPATPEVESTFQIRR